MRMNKAGAGSRISGDRIFNGFNMVFLTILTIIIVFPIWNVIVNSFSSAQDKKKKKSIFEFSWKITRQCSGYFHLDISGFWWPKPYCNYIIYTFFSAPWLLTSKGISQKELCSNGLIICFSGGGIFHLLIKSLGMLDSFWVYNSGAVLSYCRHDQYPVDTGRLPILEKRRELTAPIWRSYLRHTASKPALAQLPFIISQWNDFMTAKLYITEKALYPLQMKLYEIIVQQQMATMTNPTSVTVTTTAKGIQLATIIVTTLPIIIIYPLLQKHFVTGMMLGAVKE